MSKTVLIFPGQGSQTVGMGRDVAAVSAAAASVFSDADRVLGFDLSRTCFEGPEAELTRTDVQQPAIFVTSVAVWRALLERGASEDVLLGAAAGLSLGEYTALHVAGAIPFDDALTLVRRRGEFMQRAAGATPGGMVSIIGGEESSVADLCAEAAGDGLLVPANFNCPGQIVISGTADACGRAVQLAGKHGVRAVKLNVAGAFHSPLMASAAEELAAALDAAPITAPRCPVIANVDAAPHAGPAGIRKALRRQVTEAVRWQQSVEGLIAQGFDRFIEIGPGRVLTGLMRKIDRKIKTLNVGTAAGLDIDKVLSTHA